MAMEAVKVAVSSEREGYLRAVMELEGFSLSDEADVAVTQRGGNVIVSGMGDDVILLPPLEPHSLASAVREKFSKAPAPDPKREEKLKSMGKKLMYNGNEIKLTRRERVIFDVLYKNRGNTVARETLREAIGRESESNIVDVYITYLRRKLTPHMGEGIITAVRGVGYVMREN